MPMRRALVESNAGRINGSMSSEILLLAAVPSPGPSDIGRPSRFSKVTYLSENTPSKIMSHYKQPRSITISPRGEVSRCDHKYEYARLITT